MSIGQGVGRTAAANERSKWSEGQMVVELAVVAPVMIVVAIIVLNLMVFVGACARFDRIVPDTIMAVAVSPSTALEEDSSQAHAVAGALSESMKDIRGVEVSVNVQTFWEAASEGIGFMFAPHLTRYVCTMTYRPWPSSFTVAGIEASVPVAMTHERSFTVDRYRSGVVF